jgi:tryptophanyl-tRNA synthetase
MALRPLKWRGSDSSIVVPVDTAKQEEGEGGDGKLTKNQMKKLLKQQAIDAKKAAKAKEKEAKVGTVGESETPPAAEASS